ncbi:MAG TPA: diguanylate cyclase [Gammaproteobacteria bacterium]|jgi:GGDEF domain-containing protein
MFDSNQTQQTTRHDTQVTVFPSRQRFEAGVTRVLSHHSGEQDCAVLHVALQGSSGTGSVSLRMLNLVGNALRAGTRRGCLAYLGDAEFAVLLQDTDAREAAAYARTLAIVIESFHTHWEDEVLTVQASIGGVMAGDGQDGHELLRQARDAGRLAQAKPGCHVHLRRPEAPARMRAPLGLEPSFA